MSHRPAAFSAERLLQTLQSLPAAVEYLVGFSGGADSTALLHALSLIRDQLSKPVSAIHINHGLHADADRWQTQCVSFCAQIGVNLNCLRIKLENNSGKGLEAEARELRYAAISAFIKPGGCLLTAHHANDQAETLLLNLMRGSGVDGLSAMPVSRAFGEGLLQRPLLEFQSDSLKDYLISNRIEWTEDPSNQHRNHDRNFVRHEVIPLLEKRWPKVTNSLLLSCKAMSDTRKLLESVADDYLRENLPHRFVLNLTNPIHTNPELLKLVIRRWLKQLDATSIPVHQLESFCQQLQNSESSHKVTVAWKGWVLRLYRKQLWLETDHKTQPYTADSWPKNCARLDLGKDAGELLLEGSNPVTPDGEFSVVYRQDLEKTVIEQGDQHKSLKNLFQTAGIPPWLRDSIPLCRLEGELVSVGDWCFSAKFSTWMSESDSRLSWRPAKPLLQFIQSQQHRQEP